MERDKTNRSAKYGKAIRGQGLEEGDSFNFFVDPQAKGANVMSSKGDIYDYYEDETEARRVAEQLNAQYGKVDEDMSRMRKLAGLSEAVDEFDTDTADMFADTHPKRKVVEIVREILKKHKIEWRGGSWEGSRNVKGYIGRDGRRHLDYPEFERAATPKQVKLVSDEIRQNLPQAEINMDEWGLSVITETASGGATGAGAIASSPSAMNGMQKRNPSIYGQTKLKKKPTPKTRITKEDASAGIGRNKKT